MRERKKAERVKILGAQIDPIRIDRAMNLTSHYLELFKLEYIVFVNTAAALLGQDLPEFSDFLLDAALVLPGDKNIENALEKDLKIGEEKSYQSEYFTRLFSKLNRTGASIYAMQDKEDDLQRITEMINQQYDRITIEGSVWQEEENPDATVNAINILAPDILIICGSYERIYRFLREYKSKINAGLCLCIEEVVAGSEKPVPSWAQTLHLEGLYRWLFEKSKDALNDSLFKKKLKENTEDRQD
jgi:UDP-N-acetyl-D-mannosaminuronic acid transferase (WecB/TagA/CpsF family)